MDVNDTQETDRIRADRGGGPQRRPAELTPKRRTRAQADRVIGGVCGGLGRYFNVDPLLFRIGAVALVFLGGAGILLYLAALLLVPNEDQPAPIAPGAQGRNRALVIAGVVALLIVAWPFLLFGGALFAGFGIPLAVLVGAGVLVWWLVSGEATPAAAPATSPVVRRSSRRRHRLFRPLRRGRVLARRPGRTGWSRRWSSRPAARSPRAPS